MSQLIFNDTYGKGYLNVERVKRWLVVIIYSRDPGATIILSEFKSYC